MVLRAQWPLGTTAQFFHFVAEEKKKKTTKNKGILSLGYHRYPSKKRFSSETSAKTKTKLCNKVSFYFYSLCQSPYKNYFLKILFLSLFPSSWQRRLQLILYFTAKNWCGEHLFYKNIMTWKFIKNHKLSISFSLIREVILEDSKGGQDLCYTCPLHSSLWNKQSICHQYCRW